MSIKILLPALSPTMATGNLVKWHKALGDVIKAGDLLAEVETDKATMEIEAVDDGKLAKILIPENTMDVPVNSVIAIMLEDDEEDLPDQENSVTLDSVASVLNNTILNDSIGPNEPANLAMQSTQNKIFISPLAKRIAEQKNINVSNLIGSGPNGRIIKADLLDYINKTINLAQNLAPKIQSTQNQTYTTQTHTTMRKVIASRLVESKQTIPHFYLTVECALDHLMVIRQQVNTDAVNKISINDFIIKAVALSMKSVPDVNSSWGIEGIKKYTNIDISVAVSIDDGLITPIIMNADTKSISDISLQMKDLAKKARENKLKPEEFQGGGFTISNLGMFGVKNFSAIINPPQTCILAIGATQKKPIVNNDKIEIANIIEVTLSCDHRVVDGVLGANFLKVFKSYIENPIKMLI